MHMEYKATAKYVRVSTRKIRLVSRAVGRLRASDALVRLETMGKQAARPIRTVLASAITNARDSQLDPSKLTIKQIEVMGGPGMKRWRAISRGQAHGYKKRMTHIRVVLTDEGKI